MTDDPLIRAELSDQDYAQQANDPTDPRVRNWLKRVIDTTEDDVLRASAHRALAGEAEPYDVAQRARGLLALQIMKTQFDSMTQDDLAAAGFAEVGQQFRDRLARSTITDLGVPPEIVARAKAAEVWPDERESLLAKAERMPQVADLLPPPAEPDPDRPEEA